jgi:hypothetical protein
MKTWHEEIELIKTKGSVWYIKWIATVVVIIAVMCRSVEEVPRIYDQVFSFVGTAMWLWVGLQWKDRALTVLNSVLMFVLGAGLLRSIVQWVS